MAKQSISVASDHSFLNASGKLPYRLTNDYLFRAVLQENAEVLTHLISALLDIPYPNIASCTITNPIVLGESFDSKTIIMDVRVLLNNHTLINLEMQMGDLALWPNRSLYYLCKLYCNLERGHDYDSILPSVHIGILPHSPFPEMTDFYSEYLMMNRKNHHIFSGNFSLRMLCLDQIGNVPEEEKASELYTWAALFTATTWEEIRMLAQNSDIVKTTASTMYQLTAEEKIRLQCEARERYEHDTATLLKRGREAGKAEGLIEGRIEGKIEGKAEATKQFNKLARFLHADNRIDDFIRSTTDPEFQQELLREYHLLPEEP